MSAHQNNKAEIKNERCCSVCTHSLCSTASNNIGTCQVHKATAWTSHATSGIGSQCHVRFTMPILPMLPTRRDHSTGKAQRKTTRGRPNTSKGAATSISTSCCVMWAEKSTLPHACSGDTSATNNANHPPTKQSPSHVRRTRG